MPFDTPREGRERADREVYYCFTVVNFVVLDFKRSMDVQLLRVADRRMRMSLLYSFFLHLIFSPTAAQGLFYNRNVLPVQLQSQVINNSLNNKKRLEGGMN